MEYRSRTGVPPGRLSERGEGPGHDGESYISYPSEGPNTLHDYPREPSLLLCPSVVTEPDFPV